MIPVGLRIAINNLRMRRGRTVLIIIAIALATSMVVAVSSAIRSANQSVRSMMEDSIGRTDLRIRHEMQGKFTDSVTGMIRSWPEITEVAPQLVANLPITNLSEIDREVERDPTIDREELAHELMRIVAVHGVDYQEEWLVHPTPMLVGRHPLNENEMLVDPRVASRMDVRIGDRVRVGSFGTERVLVVMGIMERQTLAILQKPEARVPLRVVQELSNQAGKLSSIDLVVGEEFDAREVYEDYKKKISPPLELVLSDMLLSGMDRQLRGSSLLEYVSVACLFLVAAFIVLTGMTTAVTERIGELAIIRCIGGTRMQVMRSQLWVGALIGFIGGVIGLPLGVVWAKIMFAIIGESVREGLHFSMYSLILSLGTAVTAGVVGAALPALAASRISPLSALGFRSRVARKRGVFGVTVVGVLFVIVCAVSLRGPDDEQVAFWLAITVGLFSMVFGFFLLSVPVVQGVNYLVSRPCTKILRLPPGMLGQSVRATPYRHGFTAGAFMLGLAAMVSMWSSGEALVKDWVKPIQFPDAFIVNMTGFDEVRIGELKAQSFIRDVCSVGTFKVPVADGQLFGVKGIAPKNVTAVVFEPTPFFRMTNLKWAQGDPVEAEKRLNGEGAILVAREFLTARGIGVGDTIRLGAADNVHEFHIVGVVSSPGLDIATSVFGIQGEFFEQAINCVFFSRSEAKRCFDNDTVQMVQFDLTDDVDDAAAKSKITAILGGGQFGSGREIKYFIIHAADHFMSIVSLFGMLGMVIAGFGAANVMAANIGARRCEYGILRTVGAPRFLLVKLIFAETMIIAFGACVVGTAMGYFDAWNTAYFYRMMAGLDISPRLPIEPTVVGWVALLLIGGLAVLGPVVSLYRAIPIALLRDVDD